MIKDLDEDLNWESIEAWIDLLVDCYNSILVVLQKCDVCSTPNL